MMTQTDNQITDSLGNLFADLGFEQIEAENLLVRSKLMAAIKAYIESEGIIHGEAAGRLGIDQAHISEIYQGKIELFSVDKLINMLVRVGHHVELTVYKAESSSSRKKPSGFFEHFEFGDGRCVLAPAKEAKSAVKDKLKNRRSRPC